MQLIFFSICHTIKSHSIDFTCDAGFILHERYRETISTMFHRAITHIYPLCSSPTSSSISCRCMQNFTDDLAQYFLIISYYCCNLYCDRDTIHRTEIGEIAKVNAYLITEGVHRNQMLLMGPWVDLALHILRISRDVHTIKMFWEIANWAQVLSRGT